MKAEDLADDCDTMADSDDNYLLNLLITGRLILEEVYNKLPSSLTTLFATSRVISIEVAEDDVILKIDKWRCRVAKAKLDWCWCTGVSQVFIKKRHLDLRKIFNPDKPQSSSWLGAGLVAGPGGIPMMEKLMTGNFSLIVCVCINRKLHVLISLDDAFSEHDQRYDLTPYIKKYKLGMTSHTDKGGRRASKVEAIPKILKPVRAEDPLPPRLQHRVAMLHQSYILKVFIDGRYLIDRMAFWWQCLKGDEQVSLKFDHDDIIFRSPLSMQKIAVADCAWYWNENVSAVWLDLDRDDFIDVKDRLGAASFTDALRCGQFELELAVDPNRHFLVRLHFAVPGTPIYAHRIPVDQRQSIEFIDEHDKTYRSADDLDRRLRPHVLSYTRQVLNGTKSQHLTAPIEEPIIKPVDASRALDFSYLHPERPPPNIQAMMARADPSNRGGYVAPPVAGIHLARDLHAGFDPEFAAAAPLRDMPFRNVMAQDDDLRWLEEQAARREAVPAKRVEMFPDPPIPAIRAQPPKSEEEKPKAAELAKKTIINGITMPDKPEHPEKEAVEGELECKQCLDRKLGTINLNCGCLFFCIACSYDYVNAGKTVCPLCQEALREIKRCFI